MTSDDFCREWGELSQAVVREMAEWRGQHPRATLGEMEAAVDGRLARLRARILEDSAQASPAADWTRASAAERPVCPECGTPLVSRGKKGRRLQTQGGQTLALQRSYGICPKCHTGLFPPG